MSLYDDVILPEYPICIPSQPSNSTSITNSQTTQQNRNEIEIASWNSNSLKLLQNQVEAARRRQLNTPTHLKRDVKPNVLDKRKLPVKKEPDLTKPGVANGSELRFNLVTGKVEKENGSMFSTMDEEYDPMRPNDYEKVVKELKNNRKKSSSRERDSKKSRRRRSSSSRSRSRRRRSRSSSRSRSRDRKRRSKHSSSSEDDKRKQEPKKEEPPKRNNMFAPPPSLIESDLKPLIENPEEIKPITKLNTGLFKAEKMMAKMGYKEGEGLGRNNQGMSKALEVEKTGRRSGRIIHEKDAPEPPSPILVPPPPPGPTPAVIMKSPVIQKEAAPQVGIPPEVMKNMSKVVLLRNMVGPSEVDPDLEVETKEECQKYGEVNTCVIHVTPNVGDEEAVRIFVEFKTLPSAIKALTDLNGRFFGGRRVKATFYNLDKFKRKELSDEF